MELNAPTEREQFSVRLVKRLQKGLLPPGGGRQNNTTSTRVRVSHTANSALSVYYFNLIIHLNNFRPKDRNSTGYQTKMKQKTSPASGFISWTRLWNIIS